MNPWRTCYWVVRVDRPSNSTTHTSHIRTSPTIETEPILILELLTDSYRYWNWSGYSYMSWNGYWTHICFGTNHVPIPSLELILNPHRYCNSPQFYSFLKLFMDLNCVWFLLRLQAWICFGPGIGPGILYRSMYWFHGFFLEEPYGIIIVENALTLELVRNKLVR